MLGLFFSVFFFYLCERVFTCILVWPVVAWGPDPYSGMTFCLKSVLISYFFSMICFFNLMCKSFFMAIVHWGKKLVCRNTSIARFSKTIWKIYVLLESIVIYYFFLWIVTLSIPTKKRSETNWNCLIKNLSTVLSVRIEMIQINRLGR